MSKTYQDTTTARYNETYTLSSIDQLYEKESEFKRYDKIISYWNTEPDGSGITYKLADSIIMIDNLKIYAMWIPSNPDILVLGENKISVVFSKDLVGKNLRYVDSNNNVLYPFTKNSETSSFNTIFYFEDKCKNVSSLDDYAFYHCSNLSSIICPSVLIIGNQTFSYCDNLTQLNYPVVSIIGLSAFDHCQNLYSINCPEVLSIGYGAFYYCQNLSTLSVSETNDNFSFLTGNDSDLTGKSGIVLIDNNKKDIVWGSIPYCENIKIPVDISGIENMAFAYCENLTSINCPSVLSIGVLAFQKCQNLSNIYITKATSVPTIYSDTFNGIENDYWTVWVNKDIYEQYLTADYWKDVSSHISAYNE